MNSNLPDLVGKTRSANGTMGAVGHRTGPIRSESTATPLDSKGVAVDSVLMGPVRCPTAPMVPFADRVFPTKSGKFEFINEMYNPRRTVPGFPLTLVTNFSKKWLLSQMLEKDHPKVPFIRIGVE